MEKSIILILPYFGKFHNYFNLWLKSVEYNRSITFLIVTDVQNDVNDVIYPANVRVVYMTFNELKEKVQQLFDFPIVLDTPYKLCDYRPAYGLIFREYIDGYDFWGHCDCDLIFGDIRSFVTDDNSILRKIQLKIKRVR